MDRPGLRKLLRDVNGGKIDVLVVRDLARLTRDAADLAEIGTDEPHRRWFASHSTCISTDEAHQKYSLPAQTERLEAFCKAQHGDEWTLHQTYATPNPELTSNAPAFRR